jgi:hypothetical protein
MAALALDPERAKSLLVELAPLERALELAAQGGAPKSDPPASAPNGDRLLTPSEAGARLGIPPGRLARLHLPFQVRLGHRTIRYREAGLAEWLGQGH